MHAQVGGPNSQPTIGHALVVTSPRPLSSPDPTKTAHDARTPSWRPQRHTTSPRVPAPRARNWRALHGTPTRRAPRTMRGPRAARLSRGAARLLLLPVVQVVLAEAPQHREQDALAAVGDDLGDEAAEEQAGDAVLGDGGG